VTERDRTGRKQGLLIAGVVLACSAALIILAALYAAARHRILYVGHLPTATFGLVPFVVGTWCIVFSQPRSRWGRRAMWATAVGTVVVIGGLVACALAGRT
jgi:chromate transport protein ChrA